AREKSARSAGSAVSFARFLSSLRCRGARKLLLHIPSARPLTRATRKRRIMKRTAMLLLAAATLCSTLAYRTSAQFGFTPIKRPNIANIFHPVVGQGAAYDTTDKDGKKSHMEMYVVDKEMVGTEQGYWMEVGHGRDESGNLQYGKMLV